MAVPDDTQIKALIDANLPDSPPGQPRKIKASVIRTILKAVIDWVKNNVVAGATTWLRTSDDQAGAANADDAYRTGITRFKGLIEAYTRTPNAKTLALADDGGAAIRVNATNNGPAYIELHHPSLRIDRLGTDRDGVLRFKPYEQAIAYALFLNELTATLRFPNTAINRKIVLYDANGNDHQFFGLGIGGGQMRYQVANWNDAHVWYAGSSPAASTEIMRLLGSGLLGLGKTPSYVLDAASASPTDGILAQFTNLTAASSLGAKIQIHLSGVTLWRIGIPGNTAGLNFQGFNGSAFVDVVRMLESGRVLMGLNVADNNIDGLQVNGSITGKIYQQSGSTNASQLAAGSWRIVKDTSTNQIRLWVNDNGTMKSVALS